MNKVENITKLPEEAYEDTIRKFARDGAHIPGDDDANPWVPFGDAASRQTPLSRRWERMVGRQTAEPRSGLARSPSRMGGA